MSSKCDGKVNVEKESKKWRTCTVDEMCIQRVQQRVRDGVAVGVCLYAS